MYMIRGSEHAARMAEYRSARNALKRVQAGISATGGAKGESRGPPSPGGAGLDDGRGVGNRCHLEQAAVTDCALTAFGAAGYR